MQHGMMTGARGDGGVLLENLADALERAEGRIPTAYATALYSDVA